MAKATNIQVYEYDTITVDKTDGFKTEHWEALVRFNQKKENYNKYFTLTYKGIRFKEYVGVLQAGNLTIEVLPKADRNAGEEQKDNWRNVLLQMLKECRLLKVQHLENANLLLKHNSLLEIYCRLFIEECERLLHQGLIKKYRFRQHNSFALKGRLLFSQNIRHNLVHQERFFVRDQTYDNNNLFNQLLYTTLHAIPSISQVSSTHTQAYNLLNDFPEMKILQPYESTFQSLIYNRKTERYKEALFISQLLLLHYRPDIKGGNKNVLAIMFDMNKLWEEFIYRRLKKEESVFNASVHRQQSEKFWRSDTFLSTKSIRPDIVIKKEKHVIVLDTKWKVVPDLMPSDDDLKQMYIYNLFWECDRSFLLYPAAGVSNNPGCYNDYRNKGETYTKCTVQTISILDDDNQLNKQIGSKLMHVIIEKPPAVVRVHTKHIIKLH